MKSLIVYKNNYAELTGKEHNKFLIKTSDHRELKVRAKDFFILHHSFKKPSQHYKDPDLSCLPALAGDVLNIKDLSELLFNEYTPDSAWHTYLLVKNAVYCYFNKENIVIRSQQQINKIKQDLIIKAEQEKDIATFVHNFNNKNYSDLNKEILNAIYKVALAKSKHHKVFKALNIVASPINALKLLHKIGYLNKTFNPYPHRFNIQENQQYAITTQEQSNILDLTHLKSYAIDNNAQLDIDDAISIDGTKIWVHTADIARIIDDKLLDHAKKRISDLYLPDKTYRMLPENAIKKLSLIGTKTALSIGFVLDKGNINDIEIKKTLVAVTNITYDDADNLITQELSVFYDIYKQHYNYRKNHGAFSINIPKVDVRLVKDKVILTKQPTNISRYLVAEFMIMAGRAIAEFAINRNISLPFITQEINTAKKPTQKKPSLVESFAIMRQFPHSVIRTEPHRHHGLGLNYYTRVTSPLRRFLDLVVHLQFDKFIKKQTLLTNNEMKTFVKIHNKHIANINNCLRSSDMYYKLLYLEQNPQKYQALVIKNFHHKSLVFIETVGIMGIIAKKLAVASKIFVTTKAVDIYNLTVEFTD